MKRVNNHPKTSRREAGKTGIMKTLKRLPAFPAIEYTIIKEVDALGL